MFLDYINSCGLIDVNIVVTQIYLVDFFYEQFLGGCPPPHHRLQGGHQPLPHQLLDQAQQGKGVVEVLNQYHDDQKYRESMSKNLENSSIMTQFCFSSLPWILLHKLMVWQEKLLNLTPSVPDIPHS